MYGPTILRVPDLAHLAHIAELVGVVSRRLLTTLSRVCVNCARFDDNVVFGALQQAACLAADHA